MKVLSIDLFKLFWLYQGDLLEVIFSYYLNIIETFFRV